MAEPTEAVPSQNGSDIGEAVEALQESAQEHETNPEGAFVRDGDRDLFDSLFSEGKEGEPAAEPKEEPAKEEEQEVSPETSTGQGKEETPTLSEETLRALRRAKTPQSVIDGMSQEDADAWAAQLRDIQTETDKAFSRSAELEKLLEEAEAEGGTSELEDSEDSTGFEPVTLTPEDVNPLIQGLGLDGDEEAESQLVEAFNVVVSAVDKIYQQRMGPREDPRVADLQATVQALALRQAREDLGSEYPEVKKDEGKFQEVIQKFGSLWKTGDYGDQNEAMRDAAYLVLGKTKGGEPESKPEPDTSKPPAEAQPKIVSSKAPPRELSREDADREVYDRIVAASRARGI